MDDYLGWEINGWGDGQYVAFGDGWGNGDEDSRENGDGSSTAIENFRQL